MNSALKRELQGELRRRTFKGTSPTEVTSAAMVANLPSWCLSNGLFSEDCLGLKHIAACWSRNNDEAWLSLAGFRHVLL